MRTDIELPSQKTISSLLEENPELSQALRWTVVYGLATQQHIKDYITGSYEENRIEYFQAYKQSDFAAQAHDFSFFTSETHDMLIRTAGIFSWAEQQQDYSLVFSLVHKGYKRAWNYVKRFKEVNVLDFYQELSRLKTIDFTEDEIRMQVVMGIFVCTRRGQACFLHEQNIEHLSLDYISIVVTDFFEFIDRTFRLYHWKNLQLDIWPESTRRQELEQKLKVKKSIQTSLRRQLLLIQSLEMPELTEDAPAAIFTWKEYEKYVTDRAEQILIQGQTRTMFPLREWLEVSGIESEDLLEQFTLSYAYFEKLFNAVEYYLEETYIKEEEVDLLVNVLLMLSALAEEYRKTKKKYFSLHSEEWEYQLQEKEKEWKAYLRQKESARQKSEAEWKQIQQTMAREIQHFQQETKRLEKKVQQLEAEISSKQQSKKEFEALKAFITRQETENISANPAYSFAEKVSWLNEKNIVIIGGHPNWQSKLKEIFPRLTIVATESLNRDLNFLDYADAVFVNTNFLSHSLYWKVMNQMNQNNIPLHYIDRSTNIERTVTCLFESLQLCNSD